jgi:hypothetical protein
MFFRKRRARERRISRRFEIVGQLWGTLEWSEPWPLRNIGRGGALVEGPRPLALESTYGISLSPTTPANAIRARVCHLSRVDGDHASNPYLIGFEFLPSDERGEEQIETLLAELTAVTGES